MKILTYSDYIFENKKEDNSDETEKKKLDLFDRGVEKTAIGFVQAMSFIKEFTTGDKSKSLRKRLIILIFAAMGIGAGLKFISQKNLDLPKPLIEEVRARLRARRPVIKEQDKGYVVKKKDTFYSIARNHNKTVKELRKLNPQIKNIEEISPGDLIIVE